MKLIILITAFLFVSVAAVHAEEKIIPEIITLAGKSYKSVKPTRREKDVVTIIHSEGVKKLKFSELDKENGMLIGLEEYQKEIAAIENEKNTLNAAKAEKDKKIEDGRKKFVENTRNKKRKDVWDWYFLYIFDQNMNRDFKNLFGRPPDSQIGNSLVWRGECWNPTTEKMEDIWVTDEIYKGKWSSDPRHGEKTSVFSCGDERLDILDRSLNVETMQDEWLEGK